MNTRVSTGVVYIVDGDESVRRSLGLLMRTLDVDVESFSCAEDFLHDLDPDRAACMIVEVNLPGMSGIDLMQHMNGQGVRFPVIVLASNAEVRQAVRALHLGAVDFIEKPFVDQILLARVNTALGLTEMSAGTGD